MTPRPLPTLASALMLLLCVVTPGCD